MIKHPFLNYSCKDKADALSRLSENTSIALKRIESAPFNKNAIYIGTSGGKDSVVITDLAFSILGRIPVIHTTKPKEDKNAVHPATIEFLYYRPYPVIYLPKSAGLWPKCETQIDGTRRSEFDRNDGRSTTVVIEGKEINRKNMPVYVKNGLFGLNFIYPIVDWEDIDVWCYIYRYNIEYSSEYDL